MHSKSFSSDRADLSSIHFLVAQKNKNQTKPITNWVTELLCKKEFFNGFYLSGFFVCETMLFQLRVVYANETKRLFHLLQN